MLGLGASAVAVGVALAVTKMPELPNTCPALRTDPLADGTYEAGLDMAPGVWHTDGPRDVHAYRPLPDYATVSRCRYRLVSADGNGSPETQETVAAVDVKLAPKMKLATDGCKGWRYLGPLG